MEAKRKSSTLILPKILAKLPRLLPAPVLLQSAEHASKSRLISEKTVPPGELLPSTSDMEAKRKSSTLILPKILAKLPRLLPAPVLLQSAVNSATAPKRVLSTSVMPGVSESKDLTQGDGSFSFLCRICGKVKSDLVPIYKSGQRNSKMEDLINTSLPMMVSSDDELPLVLCTDCQHILMGYHDIRKNCPSVQKMLTRMVESKVIKVAEKDSPPVQQFTEASIEGIKEDEFDADTDVDEAVESFVAVDVKEEPNEICDIEIDDKPIVGLGLSKCPDCELFIDNYSVKNHEAECEGGNIINKINAVMGARLNLPKRKKRTNFYKSEMMSLLAVHLTEDMPIILTDNDVKGQDVRELVGKPPVQDSSKRFAVTPLGYECNKCLASFKHKLNIRNHLRRGCLVKIYKCRQCDRCFLKLSRWKAHQSRHKSDRNFLCEICSATFATPTTLKNHKQTHDVGTRFKCDICGVDFKRKGSLVKHLSQKHEIVFPDAPNRPMIYCEQCPSKFSNTIKLRAHMNFHLRQTPFSCPKCSKKFATETGLRVHSSRSYCTDSISASSMKTNRLKCSIAYRDLPMQFSCDSCDKQFRLASQLKSHERTHKEGKSFQCDQCPNAYYASSALSKHKETHSGVRHPCPYCAKTFIHKNDSKRHITTHLNPEEWPFHCGECDERYKNLYAYKTHRQKVHNETANYDFKCPECGKQYTTQVTLFRHRDQKHGFGRGNTNGSDSDSS